MILSYHCGDLWPFLDTNIHKHTQFARMHTRLSNFIVITDLIPNTHPHTLYNHYSLDKRCQTVKLVWISNAPNAQQTKRTQTSVTGNDFGKRVCCWQRRLQTRFISALQLFCLGFYSGPRIVPDFEKLRRIWVLKQPWAKKKTPNKTKQTKKKLSKALSGL